MPRSHQVSLGWVDFITYFSTKCGQGQKVYFPRTLFVNNTHTHRLAPTMREHERENIYILRKLEESVCACLLLKTLARTKFARCWGEKSKNFSSRQLLLLFWRIWICFHQRRKLVGEGSNKCAYFQSRRKKIIGCERSRKKVGGRNSCN